MDMAHFTKYERYELILVCGGKGSPVDQKNFFRPKSAKKLKNPPWFYENDEIWGFYGFKVVYMGENYHPINKNIFFTTLQHHISSKKILVDILPLLQKIFKKNSHVPKSWELK